MNYADIQLTQIGSSDFLFEPSPSLNIRGQDRLIEGITSRLLEAHSARLYYDLSELKLIDPLYYAWLDALARAVHTINVRMICINMQPTAAFALSRFIQKMPLFDTAFSIEQAANIE